MQIFQKSKISPLANCQNLTKKHTFFACVMFTAQKLKFFITGSFSKCDQIRISLRFWSHLLKKSAYKKWNAYILTRIYEPWWLKVLPRLELKKNTYKNVQKLTWMHTEHHSGIHISCCFLISMKGKNSYR